LEEQDKNLAYQEVELLRSLHHPFIVGYEESFPQGGSLVIIMEYVGGGDLRSFIRTRVTENAEPLEESVVLTYTAQIAMSMQYIHRLNILHRDLKSSNLFLTERRDQIRLGDFGIARVLEGTIDAAVTVVGTPYYMSPEVCRSEPYSYQSDMWSVGCILYEMCMLKHAFESTSLLGLVYKIVSEQYDPIPSVYSSDVDRLVRSLLDKAVANRPNAATLVREPVIKKYIPEPTWAAHKQAMDRKDRNLQAAAALLTARRFFPAELSRPSLST
jgi:NIMA (never in mitosis gene a)-related kinase